MLKKYKLIFLIAIICFLELIIFSWALLTDLNPHPLFEKCARNSGRVSAALNLIVLFYLGIYGLRKIYTHTDLKDTFLKFCALFTINHIIHLFFIIQNFNNKAYSLNISENSYGFITFSSILIFPIITWRFKKLSKSIYFTILIYIFNTTYFMIETFYTKIKPERPEYLHRFGILVMIVALLFIIFQVYRENDTQNTLST